jgi:hypothetical protein
MALLRLFLGEEDGRLGHCLGFKLEKCFAGLDLEPQNFYL